MTRHSRSNAQRVQLIIRAISERFTSENVDETPLPPAPIDYTDAPAPSNFEVPVAGT